MSTPPIPGDLNPQLLNTPEWPDQMVAAAGIPIIDIPLVLVGGGIGSFVTADYLRIYGVPTTQIRILSNIDHPWQTYEYLTRVSQIPRPERIRSDSSSRPDNIWGFPPYTWKETFREKTLKHWIQTLTEPIFSDFWTPTAKTVFESMEREAQRISYWDMLVKGQVRMVRRRAGGGYFTILTPPEGASQTKRVAFRSQYVHLAIGYPGLRFLPDLQEFREKYQDYQHVVNAYEPHEHVYDYLRQRPGTVLVRGGGIVAARVLQRLINDRKAYGLKTQILHLFRTFVTSSHGDSIFMRRKGANGWAYQGFNYPKSVWGGQLKAQMRKLDGDARATLYKRMGGTNTPKRRKWEKNMAEGRRENWYHPTQGEVDSVEPTPDGKLVTNFHSNDGVQRQAIADFIIDCTGLEADITEHRVLEDLLRHSGAYRNPLGRLEVETTFEVKNTANGGGALYASGSATLGGYFPGVDTFLGLQVAAQEIADDLAKRRFCKKMGPFRSTTQWFKWAFNSKI